MAQAALEKEVIASAQRGDRDAFTEIYRSHSRRVFRHIFYLTGDAQESDDLTNETFLRVWRAIHKYEDRGLPFENWLLKIAHNLAVRHFKKRRPVEDIANVRLEDSHDRLPEHLVEVACDVETVRAAILQLPNLPRQVVIWRFLENMSYEEVGRMVGKSNGAIRVIQFRALKQLRGILESMEWPDHACAPGIYSMHRRSLRLKPGAPNGDKDGGIPAGQAFSSLVGAPPLV